MQVFGGGTSNTEYEVLTGHSMALLPYVISAYQAYCHPEEYGMVSTLKAQGYTAVAMHPNISGNWNRKNVYQYMGFDEFISSGGFQEAERLRNYVSDLGDYQRLIERYEEKEPGEKLFVFNVTMQNHGGYEEAFPDFQQEIQAGGDVEMCIRDRPRFPTLIVCGFVLIAALQSLFAGLVLQSMEQKNKQDFEMQLIAAHETYKSLQKEAKEQEV